MCRLGCHVSHHAHDVVSPTYRDKKTGMIKQRTPQQLQKLKDKQVCVTPGCCHICISPGSLLTHVHAQGFAHAPLLTFPCCSLACSCTMYSSLQHTRHVL